MNRSKKRQPGINRAKRRKILTSNAAHIINGTLTRLGVNCVILSDTAGHNKLVKVMIMPTTIPIGYIEQLLITTNPAFNISRRKDGTFALRYFDFTIPPPQQNWCEVELVGVSNSPTGDSISYVRGVSGPPTLSQSWVAIERIRQTPLGYCKSNKSKRSPSVKRLNRLLNFLALVNWLNVPEALCQEAVVYLQGAQSAYPELSPTISTLFCRCLNKFACGRLHQHSLPPISSVETSMTVPQINFEDDTPSERSSIKENDTEICAHYDTPPGGSPLTTAHVSEVGTIDSKPWRGLSIETLKPVDIREMSADESPPPGGSPPKTSELLPDSEVGTNDSKLWRRLSTEVETSDLALVVDININGKPQGRLSLETSELPTEEDINDEVDDGEPPTLSIKISEVVPEVGADDPTVASSAQLLELPSRVDIGGGKSTEGSPVETPELISEAATILKRNCIDSRIELLCPIAQIVVDILDQLGLRCALFGSLASYLYGNTRAPNDIDMIAFPTKGKGAADSEKIKRDIVAHDPAHFILRTPRDPRATYRVLYFRIDPGLAPNRFIRDMCKVDILVPGALHLPCLTEDNITWRSGLPVIPFAILLLQKLQAWDDHIHMEEEYKYKRHETDAMDIQDLLKLEHVVPLRFSQPWDNLHFFSEKFMQLSRERVTDFCIFNPQSAVDWSLLGFDIHYYAEEP